MISAGISRELRRKVYEREGFRCALCDSTKYIQVHHVVKRSLGGPDTEQNLVCLCADCHALAHGTDVRGLVDANDPERMVNQAIIEYLSDLYAEQGVIWNPWGLDKYGRPRKAWRGG